MEAQLIDEASPRDLLEEFARRIGVATGKVKLELILVDGKIEDGYRHHRLDTSDLDCLCARHAWSPNCPRHPSQNLALGPSPQ